MTWTNPHTRPALGSGHLHVWRVDLDGADAPDDVLSSDERARAARFHFERHRRRFRRCHGALRRILGGYLGVDPAEIRLRLDARDKPRLAGRTPRPASASICRTPRGCACSR